MVAATDSADECNHLEERDTVQDNIRALGRLLRGAAIASRQAVSSFQDQASLDYLGDEDDDDDPDQDDDLHWNNARDQALLDKTNYQSISAERWKEAAYQNIAGSAADEKSEQDGGLGQDVKKAAADVAQEGKPAPTTEKPNMVSTDKESDDENTSQHKESQLRAIKQEFGEMGVSFSGCPQEQFITDIPSLLIRTVGIHGALLLTTRRLCFLAFIPPSNSLAHPSEADNATPQQPDQYDPVLKSGPAMLHHPRRLRPRRGIWVELRKNSITCYPSSRKLYRPLKSVRLSEVDGLLPYDYSKPNRLILVGPSRWLNLEFDNIDATMDWRREIEGANFSFHNTAEKIRIMIPLERILYFETSEYPQIAHALRIDVLNDHQDAGLHKLHLLDPNSNTCGVSEEQTTTITFGVLLRSTHMIKRLREAILPYYDWSHRAGTEQVKKLSPSPILEIQGPKADVHKGEEEGEEELETHHDRASNVCRAFGLAPQPEDLKLYRCSYVKALPAFGTLSIGLNYLCFWRKPPHPFEEVRIKIPLSSIVGVETYRAFRWHHYGLTVHVHAHPDLYFDFNKKEDRKAVLDSLVRLINASSSSLDVSTDSSHHHYHPHLHLHRHSNHSRSASTQPDTPIHIKSATMPFLTEEAINLVPKLINPPADLEFEGPKLRPMRFYCLTIGSRGDVQPYIALCKGLKAQGHHPVIVSHPEYRDWVEGHGIEYRGVGGDPGALMKLSVEHRIFSPAFFKESIGKFRVWLDELLRESWEQCQGAEVLIESPSTMAGIHVAEGLGIPYFRAFTMPWTKTSAYPQAFSVPSVDLGPSYNLSSYVLFDQVLWTASSGQINRWRKHMVGIGPTNMTKMAPDQVPFIYNFSPAVVPVPNDWSDRIGVTGYWFLENPDSKWSPPDCLVSFIMKAKKEGRKLAYIGFGSIMIQNAAEVTQNIYKAIRSADVRAIVAKGWSNRKTDTSAEGEKEEQEHLEDSYPEVYVVDSVPHDWLFPQLDMAMHHGGAGTTGASLRAGLVTLIKPFFGDQFFWALRVHKLGAGVRVSSLSESGISDALKTAATDRVMVEKAKEVGSKIQNENGVKNAITFLGKQMALAKHRTRSTATVKVTEEDLLGIISPTMDSARKVITTFWSVYKGSPASEEVRVEKTEEERMAHLRGYRNAKAEDIRRRRLLEEKMAADKLAI